MSAERKPPPGRPPEEDAERSSLWDAYWERFRRQQVDDPVETRREGLWERFQRQAVDDPVRRRRSDETPE
jgi:hypothetical protein